MDFPEEFEESGSVAGDLATGGGVASGGGVGVRSPSDVAGDAFEEGRDRFGEDVIGGVSPFEPGGELKKCFSTN